MGKSMNRPLRHPKDFVQAGLVAPEWETALEQVTENFVAALPDELRSSIDLSNPDDPVAKQFVPDPQELHILPEEYEDPIGDNPFTPIKGITHRYPDRLLLKPVHVCPAYCRFCFRREKVGSGSETLTSQEMEAALDYIRQHPEVWEVILSGGDPFLLSKRRLASIIEALDAMEHVEVIRIHTRVPVVSPSTIDMDFVQVLKVPTPVYVILHCNHPQELSNAAQSACAQMSDVGIPLLSQTVLLRGINDTPEVMERLLRQLTRLRIKPYYLHHPDLAQGTSHFRVSIAEGQALMQTLRGRISGLCLPTYILDIPGGYGKVPIGPNYLLPSGEPANHNTYLVTDVQGRQHTYSPGASPKHPCFSDLQSKDSK